MAVPNPKAVAFILVPAASAVNYVEGDPLCYDANGRAVVCADTAGIVYAGLCGQARDNTNGGNDAFNVIVIPPSEQTRYLTLTFTGATQAKVGELAYWGGAKTVTATAGNGVKAGLIVALLAANVVMVDTMRLL